MPIDLNQIPPKAPPVSRGPSLLALAMVLVVLTLFGVALVLFGWPRTRPTGTPTFWLTILVAPFLAALIVTVVPYSWHAGKLRAMNARNEVRERRKTGMFAHASRPLAVLASTFYISPAPEENDVNAIASGKLVLAARPLPDRSRTARARWLNAPPFEEGQDVTDYDEDRQRIEVQEIFRRILDDLGPVLKALPRSVPLHVNLGASTMLAIADCESRWKEEWAKRGLPNAMTTAVSGETSIMRLDEWLDLTGRQHDFVSLTVAVQLHPLLTEVPPGQSAEAVAAVLLAPDEIAAGFGLPRIACLHRPNAGTLTSLSHTLKYALTWGRTSAAEIGCAWHTGFDENSGKVLADELRDATSGGTTASHSMALHDLDTTVGRGGSARNWLAIACAAKYVPWTRSPQIVVGLDREAVEIVVVRRPDFS